MSTTTQPLPDDDSDPKRSDEISRRLDALKRSSDAVSKAGEASSAESLPNLPAQKLLTMHSRIDARHAQITQQVASGNAATKALLVAMGEDLRAVHRLLSVTDQQRGEINCLRDQFAELDRTVTVGHGNIVKFGFFAGVMLLSILALIVGKLGGLFP